MRIKFLNKFIGVSLVAVILAITYFSDTRAIATFPYQAKILDLIGDPVTNEITVMITLWSSDTRDADDYLVTKLPETNDSAYVYHGIYTATPNAFGVISIEIGSGLYPLPDPLPSSDTYMDVQIKESSEADSLYDLMDNRIKSTGILLAVTSQIQSDIGDVSSADLIIFDDSTGTFSGAESHDMGTTDLVLQFGNTLTKKILTTWENISSWWEFTEKVNFTGGLYLNGTEITTLINAGGNATFTGITSVTTTDGNFSYGGEVGYEAGNSACNAEFSGSHMCTVEEITNTINISPASYTDEQGWVIEGAPGHISNSNDCEGWTNNASSNYYGSFWIFDTDGGGAGWLAPCNNTKSILCCG